MSYQIIFSENAKNDLMSITRYISENLLTPDTARNLIDRILTAITTLDELPFRYRLCEYEYWQALGLRVMPVENYLVFYLPDETKHIVKIYRIIYGKRDIEKQFEENLGPEV